MSSDVINVVNASRRPDCLSLPVPLKARTEYKHIACQCQCATKVWPTVDKFVTNRTLVSGESQRKYIYIQRLTARWFDWHGVLSERLGRALEMHWR